MSLRKKKISQFPTADTFLQGDYVLGIHEGETAKFPQSLVNVTGSPGPTGATGDIGDDLFKNQLLRDGLTSTPLEFTICVAAETVGGGGNKIWTSIN